MKLQESCEGVLHEKNSLILHHLVVIGILTSLSAVALDDVQQYLLILWHWFALLCEEILGFVSQLLVQRERIRHGDLYLFYCLLHVD